MVNFAIIGTGVIAKQHALGIQANESARLVAVCDMNVQLAAEFAAQYAVDKIYTDYREALADPDIHALSICTPSGMHGQICMHAAKAGKHILCEKPIEIKADKLDALVAQVEKSGIKMECVFQRRLATIPQMVKAALDSGVFGKVLIASAYAKYYRTPEYYQSAGWRATWEFDGGGCLMNQGIHSVDLISWLMGDVKRISAMTRNQFHSIEVEDTAAAVVGYGNGAVGVIECSTCTQPAQTTRFEIYCENGSIVFDDKAIRSWYLNGEELATQMETPRSDNPAATPCNPHGLLVTDLLHAIETDTEPSIGPREGRKAVDTILAIYKSSKEGKEILL